MGERTDRISSLEVSVASLERRIEHLEHRPTYWFPEVGKPPTQEIWIRCEKPAPHVPDHGCHSILAPGGPLWLLRVVPKEGGGPCVACRSYD
jgi:hypothetical protein